MNKKNICIDNSNKCSEFVRSGKCSKYKNVAQKLCKKSCGFCNPSVKDLINVYERNKSVYHTFDPVLYNINNEANKRDNNLHFNDIYGNSTKVHNYHIKKIKDDSYELDENLEIDELEKDKEVLLKSKEESDWNDYLEFQAKNKMDYDKISDKYRNSKQSHIVSLNLNRTWEKELEIILLKMKNNKIPYTKDKLLKSKKLNKKLTYTDMIKVVDNIKNKIEKENKKYRYSKITNNKFKESSDNFVKTFSLTDKKEKSKYINKAKKNNKLINYLDKVKNDITKKQNIIENMMEINSPISSNVVELKDTNGLTYKDNTIINIMPRIFKYVIIISIILICYGIILRLLTKK